MVDFKNTEIAFERKSNNELRETAWLFRMMNSNLLVNLGSKVTLFALQLKMPIQGLIKRTIFKQFCGGATFEECRSTIKELADYQVETILDYGAEGKESETAFDITVTESIKLRYFAKFPTIYRLAIQAFLIRSLQ